MTGARPGAAGAAAAAAPLPRFFLLSHSDYDPYDDRQQSRPDRNRPYIVHEKSDHEHSSFFGKKSGIPKSRRFGRGAQTLPAPKRGKSGIPFISPFLPSDCIPPFSSAVLPEGKSVPPEQSAPRSVRPCSRRRQKPNRSGK